MGWEGEDWIENEVGGDLLPWKTLLTGNTEAGLTAPVILKLPPGPAVARTRLRWVKPPI